MMLVIVCLQPLKRDVVYVRSTVKLIWHIVIKYLLLVFRWNSYSRIDTNQPVRDEDSNISNGAVKPRAKTQGFVADLPFWWSVLWNRFALIGKVFFGNLIRFCYVSRNLSDAELCQISKCCWIARLQAQCILIAGRCCNWMSQQMQNGAQISVGPCIVWP